MIGNIVGTRAEALVDEQTHNCSPILSAAACFTYTCLAYHGLSFFVFIFIRSQARVRKFSEDESILSSFGSDERHEEPTNQLLDLMGQNSWAC